MGDMTNISVGVDLGTSNLLVYVEGKGTFFNEPSLIAIDKTTQQVVSVGYEAAKLVGKTHDKVAVVRPLNGGVIADTEMLKQILVFTLEKVFVSKESVINKLIICIPSGITETEKSAIIKLGDELGSHNTIVEQKIKATAIGSGFDIFVPSGQMVIDIGGGTTDIGILSLGDVVLSRSIKVAGEYFDQKIIEHVNTAHNLNIGAQTAERIKIELASLGGEYPLDENGNPRTYKAMGRDVDTGLPQQAIIQADEIREVLLECFEAIKTNLLLTLEETPPELAGDLVDNGILLGGGSSQIHGLREYIQDIVHVPVHVSNAPMTAVIDGCKKLLKMNSKHYFGEV